MLGQRLAKRSKRNRKARRSFQVESLEDRRMLCQTCFIWGTDPCGGCDPSSSSGDATESASSSGGSLSYNSSTTPGSSSGPGESTVLRGSLVYDSLPISEFDGRPSGYDILRVEAPGLNVPVSYYNIAGLTSSDEIYLAGLLSDPNMANGEQVYSFNYTLRNNADEVWEDGSGSISAGAAVENRNDSAFGAGWWLDDFEYLTEDFVGGTVAWNQNNNGNVVFHASGPLTFDPVLGIPSTLRAGPTHQLEIVDNYSTVKGFTQVQTLGGTPWDSRYLIDTVYDANGNAILEFEYDDLDGDNFKDELISKTDEFGRTTHYSYYDNSDYRYGLLSETVDYANRKTSFDYNTDRQLTDIYEPEVMDEQGNPVTPHTQYAYLNGLLWKVTNPNNEFRTYQYSTGGRLSQSTDFEGNTYTYGSQMTKPYLQAIFNPSTLASPIAPIVVTDFVASEVNERGYSVTEELDKFGQLEKRTNSLGEVTEYVRDDAGRVSQTVQTIQTDQALTAVTTTYNYDDQNNAPYHYVPESVVHPGSTVNDPVEESFTYNDYRSVRTTTDELGRLTKLIYDDSDNGPNVVKRIVVIGDEDPTPGSDDDLVTEYEYTTGGVGDPLPKGLLTAEIDPLGNRTEYVYYDVEIDPGTLQNDPSDDTNLEFGRLKQVIHPPVNGQASVTTDYSYTITASDTIVTMTDEIGRVTKHHYDALERLVKIEEPDPDPMVSTLITAATYKYDANGNLREFIDAETNSTLYEYDGNDRLTKIIEADPDSSDMTITSPITEYFYDARGNRTVEIDPLERITSYQYDPDDRLIAIVQPDADGTVSRPHMNPVNQYDVNADGYVDSHDLDAVTAASGFDPIGPSGVPEFYLDADGDGDFDGADVTAVDDAIMNSLVGLPDYNDDDGMPATRFTYDPAGNITSETDANGNTTEFRYDVRGRLVETTLPEAELGLTDTRDTPIITYAYDHAGQLIGETDANGNFTEYVYDDAGRMTYAIGAQVDPTASLDWQNKLNPFDVTNVGLELPGTVNQTDIDTINAWIGQSLGTKTSTDPFVDVNGDGSVNAADASVIQAFISSGTVDESLFDSRPVTRYVYDDDSRLIFTIDPMFAVTEYRYDERDRLVAEIGENITGAKTSIFATEEPISTIRSQGQKPVTEFSYDDANRLEYQLDPFARQTTWHYDDLDRVDYVDYPDPSATVGDEIQVDYDYDLVGNLTQVIDARQGETLYHYDDLYRLTSVEEPLVYHRPDYNPEHQVPFPQVRSQTDYEYDSAGQLKEMTDPEGRTTKYEYDDVGRRTDEMSPDPVTGVHGTLDAPHLQFSYDLVGNLTKESRNGLTGFKEWEYDELNRLRTSIDETLQSTTFQYDAHGNQLRLTDPNSNKTTWEYDGLNRSELERNELGLDSHYTHDLVGNLTTMVDREDRVTEYDYDNLYRNVEERWYTETSTPGTYTLDRTMTFGFDLIGRLTSSFDPDHDYTYDSYDDADRLTQVTMTVGALASQAVVLGLEYDQSGNRIKRSATVGGVNDAITEYEFDFMNRLELITQYGPAAATPVLTGNAVSFKMAHIGYNKASQQVEIKRYAGDALQDMTVGTTTRTYDETGRLDVLQHYRGYDLVASNAEINGYDYGYDAANRITSIDVTELIYQGESVVYGYNDRDELESATYTTQSNEDYEYDANGNRTHKNSVTQNHNIDPNNELQEDPDFTYEYDDEGNRTERHAKVGDAWTAYTWDHRNRLTSVTDYSTLIDVSQAVTYTYDASNQLIAREFTKDGTTSFRYFVYDEGQIAMQFDGTAANTADLTHRYLWGADVDQMLADEVVHDLNESGTTYWPLTDHLGTVRDIVKFSPQNTTVHVKHRQYDAYGDLLSETNRGDFNGDGFIDAVDIDHLFGFVNTVYDPSVDVNGDGVVDDADVEMLLEDIIETVYGDANLDGANDGQDFVIWNTNKFTNQEGWAYGDFNGDGAVDGLDYVIWNGDRFTGDYHAITEVLDHIFGFTGRMMDQDTGLQNNLNRWYDPHAGRWISEDPISFAGGDTNLYGYVSNTPSVHRDPNGLKIWIANRDEETRKVIQHQLGLLRSLDPRFDKLLDDLEESENPIIIYAKRNTNEAEPHDDDDAGNGKGTGTLVTYDPFNKQHKDRPILSQLAHELQHAKDNDDGIRDGSLNPDGVPVCEERAVRTENIVNEKLGKRAYEYNGGLVRNPGSQHSPLRP